MRLAIKLAAIVSLCASAGLAQTRDGATFVAAMDRTYAFVTSGDLSAFGEWTSPQALGFDCPTCASGVFGVDIPDTVYRLQCLVVLSPPDGDFRLCNTRRPFHADMPRHSPAYLLDSLLVEQWLEAVSGLSLIANQYRDPWQVHTWVTCPLDGRVQGVDTSIFSTDDDESYPSHFAAFSGARQNWHHEWSFPECELLLS